MQSVNTQLFEYEAPRFTWRRGQKCRVVLRPPLIRVANDEGAYPALEKEEHLALLCEGEGEEYEPLFDEPDVYLKFARVARAALSAPSDNELSDLVVEFAEGFGMPFDAEDYGYLGYYFNDEDDYGVEDPGLPLAMFRGEASRLSNAVGLLSAASEAEHGGNYRPLRAIIGSEQGWDLSKVGKSVSLLMLSKISLVTLFQKHLGGVRLSPKVDFEGLFDRSPGRMLPAYTCDNLLTAMWLQVYFAATERRIVRERCKGCGRPFEAKDQRQQYCDPYCRRATNQRNYYSREKRKQKEGSDDQEG